MESYLDSRRPRRHRTTLASGRTPARLSTPAAETSPLFSGFSQNTQNILKKVGVNTSSTAPRGIPPVAPGDRSSFVEVYSPSTEEIINRINRAKTGIHLQPMITTTANSFQPPGTFPSRPDSRPMQYRVADQRLEQQGVRQPVPSSWAPPPSLSFGQPVPSVSARAVPSPWTQPGTQQPPVRLDAQSITQPDNHPARVSVQSTPRPEKQPEVPQATQPEQRPEAAPQQQPEPNSSTEPVLQINAASSDQNAMVRTYSFGSVSTLTDQEVTPEPISPEHSPIEPTHPMPIQEFQPDPEDVQSEPEIQSVRRRERQKSKPELKGIQAARRQSSRRTSNTPSTYNLKLLAGTALHTPTKYLAKHIPNVTRTPKAAQAPLTATPDTSLSLAESRISSRSTSRPGSTKGKTAAPKAATTISSRPPRRVRGFTEAKGLLAGEAVLKAFREAQARMRIKGSTRLERIINAMNEDDGRANGTAQLTPPESVSGNKGTSPQDAIAIDSTPSEERDGESANNARKRKRNSSVGSAAEEVEVQRSTASSGRIELGSPQDSTEENPPHWANRERAGGRFVSKQKEVVAKKKRKQSKARSSTTGSDAPATPASPTAPKAISNSRTRSSAVGSEAPTTPAAPAAPTTSKVTTSTRTRSSALGAEAPATPAAPDASKATASTRARSSAVGSEAPVTPKVTPNTSTTDQQVTSRGRTVRASTKAKQNQEMRERGVVDGDE
ncbi:uncharacterized protein BDZ99DRAFT_126508 [Mytilinidion resinicola]|uniref:Uncharacterized protein n=1 Tax=Mytilinidion resinicola TaxID=574789 RepID=A0A6A6Z6Q0_9PEZI|nr:uncharacterized protein BDZ99DRAFT_126508 [Mytilinidion resinicola]KAF2815974.1 hypothetical protein BDZ99DRAFT_126508 [Mytilinidion resinicola]